MKSNYGFTKQAYMDMLESQGGACAICKSTEPKGNGSYFRVDHNHVTGEVRGLLCHHCNTSLGGFKDSPEILRDAASYLETRG